MHAHSDQPSRKSARRLERQVFSIGLIERHDNHFLIVLPSTDDPADSHAPRWSFPSGAAEPGESPEAAMRRVAKTKLGMHVEIVVGQPPVRDTLDGQEVELRFFFCGLITEEPTAGHYAETRWVLKGQLRDYEFEEWSQWVADWLLEG